MDLRGDVREGFPAFTARFEGRTTWMYLDVRGLVTVGVGCLVDPVSLALALRWEVRGRLATEDEVRAEWGRVKDMPRARRADAYRIRDGVELPEAEVDALLLRRLDSFAERLARHFPELGDFPAPAQTALLSMAWAMGPDFPPRWPHLSAAVGARDWLAAAESCRIRERGNPGIVPRNAANRALFLEAAVSEA